MQPKSLIPDAPLRAMLDLARATPPGPFVEVGVYKGGSAYHLAALANEQRRLLHLFDTFTGIPYADDDDNHGIGEFGDVSLKAVQKAIPSAQFHVGLFPDTLPDDLTDIAFVHCDCDQYQSVRAVIEHLWPRMANDGVIVFDDANTRGGSRAIREFFPDYQTTEDCCFMRKSDDRLELNVSDALTLADQMRQRGEYLDAFQVYRAVTQVTPDNIEAHQAAGVCLTASKQYAEALPWFDQTAQLAMTQLMSATCNRAVVLGELGQSTAALRTLNDVLRLAPNHSQAIYNRGIMRMQVEDFAGSIEDFDQALKLDPTMPYGDAIYARGFANMVLGNYVEGFRDFENREKPVLVHRPENGVEWTGEQNIAGKTILVFGEMGHGDAIQFGRYLPLLVQAGAKVISVVQHVTLMPLFETMEGVQVVAESEHYPPSDFWVHLMSLAFCFRTTLETVPAPLVLSPDPKVTEKWRKIIPSQGMNVGLCWAGNPESKYDQHRSVPLELLRPLLEETYDRPVAFYSFQQSVRETDAAAFDSFFQLRDLGPWMTDFRETQHAMQRMDLMITCDTSVAHLAATMDIPTWLMLTQFRTYWLWMKDRPRTPWYPSVRFYRQDSDGDWSRVVERLVRDLAAEVTTV